MTHQQPAPATDLADIIPIGLGYRPAATPGAPTTTITEDQGNRDELVPAGPDRDEHQDDEMLTGTVVPVDSPPTPGDWLATLAERQRTARPILPDYLTDAERRAHAARLLATHYAHVMAWHATRSPIYLLRLVGRSPRGAARLLARWGRWVSDAESAPLRAAAAAKGDTSAYLMLKREHSRTVKPRRYISAGVALAAITTAIVAGAMVPTWAVWLTVTGLLALLGTAGGRADRPIIGPAVTAPQVTKLDSETVLRALGALGIAEINRALAPKGSGIAFVSPIVADGPGWRAEVDLPYGVTAVDVIERRDKLASGLRRPLGAVWPEPVSEEHPGRLVVWVGQRAMSAMPPIPWPLAKSGAVSLFDPVPFGADPRGRSVKIRMMFESVLIGAKPRMGKTFSLRVLLLAAALDPTAELRIYELKGTGDCAPLEQVAHDYGSGADDETLSNCLNTLRVAYRALETRAETIKRIARETPERCPENKVTPELATSDLGLHPMVIAVDECQELFAHDEHGEEAGRLAEAIIKRGPALGIILILATQRPDAKSLPTGVSANVGIRYCLRVMGQLENDMVLGTSSYKNGIRATQFTASDRGIGYLVGAADDPQIVRSAYIDGPAAEAIAARARAMRAAAGTLTGHAAGETPEQVDTTTIIDHLLAVWPGDANEVWSIRLVEALAAYRPDLYGAWLDITDEKARATQLANALTPYKIRTKQIKQNGVNKRGLTRESVETAAGR